MSDELLSSYPTPNPGPATKEIDHVDEHCAAFLALCPFVVVSSASAGGDPDVSPRGGPPGFVAVLDPHTIVLPDRAGNNRLDTLRKVAEQPRIALLCLVPGIDETLRLYGRAELRSPADVAVDTAWRGRPPRSVMLIHVDRAFMHCAKALRTGGLWDPDARVPRSSFPSLGKVLASHTRMDGPARDR